MMKARLSLTRGFFKTPKSTKPVKIDNISVPPPFKEKSLNDMDVSIFTCCFDLIGKDLMKGSKTLLPRGFDIYVVALHNCRSLMQVSIQVSRALAGYDDYKEYSHLTTGKNGENLKRALAMLVFVREKLVQEGSLEMNGVNTVRDRRLSALPILLGVGDLELSTPDDSGYKMSVKSANPGGTAISMRFGLLNTNVLFINAKLSTVEELHDVLLKNKAGKHAHVFLVGDLGNDAVENMQEVGQRLSAEGFNSVPRQFHNCRPFVVTRSQTPKLKTFVLPGLLGHYKLTEESNALAVFSSYRLYGGSGVNENDLPPPPTSETVSLDEDRRRCSTSSSTPPPPPFRDSMVSSDGSAKNSLLQNTLFSLRNTLLSSEKDSDFAVCDLCDKDIEQPEDCFQAMDKVYHKACIRCSDCGELITSQFYMVEDKLLCQKSYEDKFVERCKSCQEVADPLDHLIKIPEANDGGVYHVDCFKCCECEKLLATVEKGSTLNASEFLLVDGQLFCSLHGSEYSCKGCGDKVATSDAVKVDIEGSEHVFHRQCFCCFACARAISDLGGVYIAHEGEIYCNDDYIKKLGMFCTGCTETITPGSQFLSIFDKKYHKECMKCEVCGKVQTTTVSDTKIICKECVGR